MDAFKHKLSMTLVKTIAFHLAKQISVLTDVQSKSEKSVLLLPFDHALFCSTIEDQLETLELKQRAEFIADQIHKVLPSDLTTRYQIIRGMLHTRPHANLKVSQQSDENGLCGWAMMCLGPIIAKHGLSDFELSLNMLKEMTAYFSCEFDIRPFIIADQEKALSIILNWVNDADYHVRRLASEGTRPRLPWAMQIPALMIDPKPILPILSALKDDDEEYVRRSVANHLNDIAKDHPDLVANIAHEWLKEDGLEKSTQRYKNREKLVRHACRTLIKQGHIHALKAFGIEAPKVQVVSLIALNKQVKIGDTLTFQLSLNALCIQPQKLVIDYLIHHKKANGGLTPKVFKWKSLNFIGNHTFTKKHSFKIITTRKYHLGTHGISIRINGEDFAYEEFELVAS